jgi:hyperosmotically inducible protein
MLQRLGILLSTAGLVFTVACAKSDPGITSAVKAKLVVDDQVKAYQIDVDTDKGIVTLTGTVEVPAAKEQAVILARQTDGVRDVVDQIIVNPQAATTPGNVTRDLSETAQKNGREAADAVKDTARETRGTVGDAAERAGSAIADAAVTSGVKAKLLADTAVSGLKIDVDTKDGVVTLKGTVPSRAEADRAASLARETKGVKRVVNELHAG